MFSELHVHGGTQLFQMSPSPQNRFDLFPAFFLVLWMLGKKVQCPAEPCVEFKISIIGEVLHECTIESAIFLGPYF